MRIVALALLTLTSCGSTGLILKQPLIMGCREAHIPASSCPDLADGVIAYVDGDKEAAERKVRDAVKDAEPKQVRLFIKALEALDSLPGSDKFMGPVHEIVGMLEGSAAPDEAAPGKAAVVAREPVATPAVAAPPPASAERDDKRFERMRAGTVFVVDNPQTKPCATPRYPGATCLRAALGPIVITDIEWSSGCTAETFVLAGDTESPIWVLRADDGHGFSMHGSAIVVPEGTPFIVGERPNVKTPPTASNACGVTWAGWRP